MPIEKIAAWRSQDGALHDSLEEAEKHEIGLALDVWYGAEIDVPDIGSTNWQKLRDAMLTHRRYLERIFSCKETPNAQGGLDGEGSSFANAGGVGRRGDSA